MMIVAVIAIVAILNVYIISDRNIFMPNLQNIEAYAADESNKNDKDELDVCFKQQCDEEKSCECVMCQRGSTDCSPTCPCCS